MRAPWEALHAGLDRSVRTVKANQVFEEIRRGSAALGRFVDVTSLLVHLTSKEGDLTEKNRIYGALVGAAQGGGAGGQLAISIAMLGLWPGLDRTFRRSIAFVDAETPEAAAVELTAEISERFTILVGDTDLGKVNRVAASLVRGTFRDVLEARHQQWRDASRRGEMPEDDKIAGPPLREPSDLGLAPGHAGDEELGAVRRWLETVIGRDSELVMAVVVEGDNQREAADRIGLTHEAARKRFQTAMRRLREHFDVAEQALSQLGRVPGISPTPRNDNKEVAECQTT